MVFMTDQQSAQQPVARTLYGTSLNKGNGKGGQSKKLNEVRGQF